MSAEPPMYCSFCGKHNNEVVCLIAAPVAFICDECVVLCVAIVQERRAQFKAQSQARIAGMDKQAGELTAFAAAPGEPKGAT